MASSEVQKEEVIFTGNFFRRIFRPTKEEQIKDLELLIQLHENHIGHCSTCIHYEESHMSGFVTDYGECKKKVPWFHDKVLNSEKKIPCPMYNETIKYIETLKQQIELLRTE